MTVRFKTGVKLVGALIEVHRSLLNELACGRMTRARRWLARGFSRRVTHSQMARCLDALRMPGPWFIEDISILGGGVSRDSGSYMAFTRLQIRDASGKTWEFHPAWRLEGRAWRSAWLPGDPALAGGRSAFPRKRQSR